MQSGKIHRICNKPKACAGSSLAILNLFQQNQPVRFRTWHLLNAATCVHPHTFAFIFIRQAKSG